MQLCRECRYLYHSTSRIPCLSCNSSRLTIPCSDNLVEIVNRLLNMGFEVLSASCDTHDLMDYINGKVCHGKNVQVQIELGYLYSTLFTKLPPDWLVYEYHTIVGSNQIGNRYTGLSHTEDFIPLDHEELEFATNLTISNLDLGLDNFNSDGVKAVLKLGGYDTGQ